MEEEHLSSEDDLELVEVPEGDIVTYASKENTGKFHKRFPELFGQDLITVKRCTLEKEGLPRGHLIITRTNVHFFSQSKKTKVTVLIKDVCKVKKGGIMPNSIKLETIDGTKITVGIMTKRDAVFDLLQQLVQHMEIGGKEGSSSDDKENEQNDKTEDMTSKQNKARKGSAPTKTKEEEPKFFKRLSHEYSSLKKVNGSSEKLSDKSSEKSNDKLAKISKQKKKESNESISYSFSKVFLNQIFEVEPSVLNELIFNSQYKFPWKETSQEWQKNQDGNDFRNVCLTTPLTSNSKGLERNYLGKWVGTESYSIKEKSHYVIFLDIHLDNEDQSSINCTITISGVNMDQESRLTVQTRASYANKDFETHIPLGEQECNEYAETLRKVIAEMKQKKQNEKQVTQKTPETKPVESVGYQITSTKIAIISITILFVSILVWWSFNTFNSSHKNSEWEEFLLKISENPRSGMDEILQLQKKFHENLISRIENTQRIEDFHQKFSKLKL